MSKIVDEKKENLIIEETMLKNTNEKIVKKYKKGHLLGKGGFAKCFLFQNVETKKYYAAKVISKSTITRVRQRQKVNGLYAHRP